MCLAGLATAAYPASRMGRLCRKLEFLNIAPIGEKNFTSIRHHEFQSGAENPPATMRSDVRRVTVVPATEGGSGSRGPAHYCTRKGSGCAALKGFPVTMELVERRLAEI